MRKVLLIGWKDVRLAFRDRAALILMLAAPFALTLGLGFVTGRFSGSGSSAVSDIPVVVVNEDQGQLGHELVALLHSPHLAKLVAPQVMQDATLARRQVDQDKATTAIVIPAGFTASILPSAGDAGWADAGIRWSCSRSSCALRSRCFRPRGPCRACWPSCCAAKEYPPC